MRKQLKSWAINPGQRRISIVAAHYGSESALVGAAALCIPPELISKPKSHWQVSGIIAANPRATSV